MKRFAMATALAVLLGLGTAGTAGAHGMRSFSPGQSFNMGSIRTFPSFNSSPFFRSVPHGHIGSRPFAPNGSGMMPNGHMNGFGPPTLFPSVSPNFSGFGMPNGRMSGFGPSALFPSGSQNFNGFGRP